jgi:hypothetical protein
MYVVVDPASFFPVCPCDGVSEVAFDPCECCVPEPVGADLLGCDPGEMLSNPGPQVIIAASRDGLSVSVAEQLLV